MYPESYPVPGVSRARSRAEVFEAVAICEELWSTHRRVLGPSHPDTLQCLVELDRASMTLEDYRKFKSCYVSQIQSERRVVPREERVVADGDDVGAPRLPRDR